MARARGLAAPRHTNAIARRYMEVHERLSHPNVEERIRARNELTSDPILSRIYVSPLLAMEANDQ